MIATILTALTSAFAALLSLTLSLVPEQFLERAQPLPQPEPYPIFVARTQEQKDDSRTVPEFPHAALSVPTTTPAKKQTAAKKAIVEAPAKATASTSIARIQNPYAFPPLSPEALNILARQSLVNIDCTVTATGSTVSGSGMLIDPRGVILTNAHVGQYVLLSETTSGITCNGRSGAPAERRWQLKTMYIPPVWVEEHAKDLRLAEPTGTGENDYALLLVEPISGGDEALPSVSTDVREAVAFEGDPVLLASYPAGFAGSLMLQSNLYPVTTGATVLKLLTFHTNTIDVLSLGGSIVAQGGSSGGGVLNAWGRLVGILVTTSAGNTTAERDLRAITLAHVDRSLREHEGVGLTEFLDTIESRANTFRETKLNALARLLVEQIQGK